MNAEIAKSELELKAKSAGEASAVSERHRRWLRSNFWTAGLLIVAVPLFVIGHHASVTSTLRQHGWKLECEDMPLRLPAWISDTLVTRFGPIDNARVVDWPHPVDGDLELLTQYLQFWGLSFKSVDLSESSLAAISRKKELRYFNIFSSKVDEEELRHLHHLLNLDQCSMQFMDLGDAAMRHLANCHIWRFHFSNCRIDDESWAPFSKHASLQAVEVENTDVGERA